MLDVPMYFVFRDGKYIDAAGHSFRDFLEANSKSLPGEKPTEATGGTTSPPLSPVTPSFLEMRGADEGLSHGCLPAFWVACSTTRARSTAHGIWSSTGRWKSERNFQCRAETALAAPIPGGGTLRDLAKEVLVIARAGLASRAPQPSGDNETGFLERSTRSSQRKTCASPARSLSRRMGRRYKARLQIQLRAGRNDDPAMAPSSWAARSMPRRARRSSKWSVPAGRKTAASIMPSPPIWPIPTRWSCSSAGATRRHLMRMYIAHGGIPEGDGGQSTRFA